MPSKRHPRRIAAIVEDIARKVSFETRVTPHEAFAVHIGPATVPKGSSTETADLIEVIRPAVQLDDDYLIVVFPAGYKAFRRSRDGRWTRQPEGWARATECSLVKITVNVFHAMMWRRLQEQWSELTELDAIPWEESSTIGCSKDTSEPRAAVRARFAVLNNEHPRKIQTQVDVDPHQFQQNDKTVVVDTRSNHDRHGTKYVLLEHMRAPSKTRLTPERRAELTDLLEQGTLDDRSRLHVQILLLGDKGRTVAEIARSMRVSHSTVLRNVRMRLVPESLVPTLTDRPRSRAPVKLDGKQEAFNIDMACSDASEGRAHRTAKLPAARVVELKDDLPISPTAKPLGRRLSRIKKS